jgi:DNA-directed RNA polymerase specialized sigma24 family protein
MAPSAPAELPDSVLSVTEIIEGIRSLSADDQFRFKRASEYLSHGGARPAEDLRHEAVRRAIAGSRKCPRDVPIAKFLFGVMRSIAHADRKALHRSSQAVPLSNDSGSQSLFDGADPRISPEELLLRNEESASMKSQILALFEDDLTAQTLIEGQFDQMEGKELRDFVGLTDNDFATKRRFIRRRIDKAFPTGWKP